MDDKIAMHIRAYCACLHEWNAAYEDYAKSVDLNFTSLSILSALYETENCTQKMLCEQCFLPKQTVNTAVTAFYKKGWIRMQELPEDRRNKTIHFTEKGQYEAERILQKVHQSERTAMGGLSEEEQGLLLALTRRYIAVCKDTMKGL